MRQGVKTTSIYYARSYEIKGTGQTRLLGHENNSRFIPIYVPNRWVRGSGSRIVALFHKTGPSIVCPHFWELKAWTGCPFRCSYCYLQGTFRGTNRKLPRLKDKAPTARFLGEFLRWADSLGLKTLLNAGEIADSLAVTSYVQDFLNIAIPLLRKHPTHKILFLTKAGTHHIKVLEKIPYELRGNFIVSFSINPQAVVEKYEEGTASSSDRIEAAQRALEMGFQVRIRIDPMIPIDGWILYYTELVRSLLENVKPERITLGTLRALKKTILYAEDKDWLRFAYEDSPWGKRIEKKLRIRMYELVIEALRTYGFKRSIALCKETPDIWEILASNGLLEHPGTPGVWENVMCNCKL